MPPFYVHPQALVESETIGDDTRIWAFAHVMRGAVIGRECNLGDHTFVETGACLGRGVTLKNGVCVWEGVELGDFVFVGPNAVFTNDQWPRSPRGPAAATRYHDKGWLVPTRVEEGATIGANATIRCGVRLGRYCLVGAGAVVTRDVPPFGLVYGTPAVLRGYVNREGAALRRDGEIWREPVSGKTYRYTGSEMQEITS